MLYMTTRCATSPRGVEQRGERRDAHQNDAVLRGEAVGERRERCGTQRVHRHVGEHARPIDKAGLGGDDEQRALGEAGSGPRRRRPRGDACRRPARARTAFRVLPATGARSRAGSRAAGPQAVNASESPCRASCACRSRRGLAHDRQTVGDRLDAGVGAAAQRIGVHEQEEQPAEPERRHPSRKIGRTSLAVPAARGACKTTPPRSGRRGSRGRGGRPAAARDRLLTPRRLSIVRRDQQTISTAA